MNLIAVMMFWALQSCKGNSSNPGSDPGQVAESEDFHADNDIAMTIRSIADAIRVGEPLDSLDYDFQGILTDGEGSPLYTNLQGMPGVWIVDVIDTGSATIKNQDLGDLLPNDLRSYVLQCLNLDENCHATFVSDQFLVDDEADITVYDFDGGYLRFEIRDGEAPNGLEGSFLTIMLCADLPVSAGTQKEG